MRQGIAAFTVAALFAAAAPALAQAQQQQQPTQATANSNASDANRLICEKESETGSRLASHKICKTKAQWDDIRRDQRGETEHVQMQRSMDAATGH